MTTYKLKLENDILWGRFGETAANNDQLVKDINDQLNALISSGNLPGGSLLGINGEMSIHIAYAMTERLMKRYDAIAIYDPKLSTYIISATESPKAYPLGHPIELTDYISQNPVKVVLCGPPHSGKSCLREGLKRAFLRSYRAELGHYPYIITACPDGEGSWYSEAVQKDEDLAKELKARYQAGFTPEFARTAAQWVQKSNRPLNIIDTGGKISDENRTIMEHATHAIILYPHNNVEGLNKWRNFCQESRLKVIAVLASNLEQAEDSWSYDTSPSTLTGYIHHLVRGVDASQKPIMQELINIILEQYRD
jgi:CRISPR-associated protein Csx3